MGKLAGSGIRGAWTTTWCFVNVWGPKNYRKLDCFSMEFGSKNLDPPTVLKSLVRKAFNSACQVLHVAWKTQQWTWPRTTQHFTIWKCLKPEAKRDVALVYWQVCSVTCMQRVDLSFISLRWFHEALALRKCSHHSSLVQYPNCWNNSNI